VFLVESGFQRRSDAEEARKRYEGERAKGRSYDPRRRRFTLAAYFPEFIKRPSFTEATRALYEQQWSKHIEPALGSRALSKITRADVKRLIGTLESRGVGKATLDSVHRLLRSVLSSAIDDEIISANPASGIDVPKAKRREIRFLTPQEVGIIAGEVAERYRALVLLLSYRGLRIGEAVFLRAKHFDPMRGRLQIEGAAAEVRGKRIEGPTKNGKKRTVVLPPFLRDELARHLAAFGAPLDPESFIFTADEGGPVRQGNFRSRVWVPACRSAGLFPAPRVHDLRHTAASLAIAADANPKVIQEMLGHSSIVVTMDRYGHLFETLQDDLAEKQEALYGVR
jgi:integrase